MRHTLPGTFPVYASLPVSFMMIACFHIDWSALTSKVALQNRSGLLHQKQPGRVRHQASLHWHGLQQTSRRRCLPLMEPYWLVLAISLLNTSPLQLLAAQYWHSLSSKQAVNFNVECQPLASAAKPACAGLSQCLCIVHRP